MHDVLLALAALSLLCSCSYGNNVAIVSIDVGSAQTNRNLVINGGFESINAEGFAEGWAWDKRNTDASCVVDDRMACEGRRSLRISNGTPLESPYTGQLWTSKPISVEPGRVYTLSAWTRSVDPGLASICAGHGWPYRIMLPPTGGDWRLVSTTFVPIEADRSFTVHVQTESPTGGFWLDNIKLEEGSWVTLTGLPKDSAGSVQLLSQSQELEVFSEGEFSSSFLVFAPRALACTLEATISGVRSKVSRRIDLAPGVVQVVVKGRSDAAGYAPRTLTLRLTEGGKQLASAQTDLRFYSVKHTQMRLDEMQKRLPAVKAKLDKLRASGHDISYPLVSYTVMENFIGYAREDAGRNEIKRAVQQLSDLESIEGSLNKDIADALSGRRRFPVVPRWTGDARPVVRSSSFVSTTKTQGKPGVETRPVFLTGYGHFGQVMSDIEKFPGYGVNMIQIEVGPSSTMPDGGKVDVKPAQDILALLDRARDAGVAVNLLLSPHYVPQWVHEKIRASLGAGHYCLRAPESQEMLKRHISVVLGPIKDHPALHSICLSNEPTHHGDSCELALRDWHAWLADKHGDIDTLNRRWNTGYASFGEVRLPYENGQNPREPIGRWVDCVRWNQEFFTGWHKMLADAVHDMAPGLPVHAKVQTPTLLGYTDVAMGNDAYLYGLVTDINGNDNINWPSFGHGEFAQSWMTNARGCDLQRSVKDAPVFNSENHVIGDRDTRYIESDHVRAALWQQAIHGQSATTIWVWERTLDRSHDFAGSIMHRPECARAVGVVNHDLNRAAAEVTALQQAPPQALILHSTSALIHDGEPYDNCMKKLYMALAFCGVRIGFVTERQLETGGAPSAPVVFVSNARHLSDAAYESLQKYRGRLVLVGEGLLTRNEYGVERLERLDSVSVRYHPADTSARDLWKAFLPLLRRWGAQPEVRVVDRNGRPVWGVECRAADTSNGTVVNLCNYLNVPVTVQLVRGGRGRVKAEDVLSGGGVSGLMRLRPLEFRLLRARAAEG